MRKLPFAVACAASLFVTKVASAFCGFYVAGADAKLFADASQVVLMREGTRTILSMQNDYKGPPEKFALVIPVPVVLQKEQVKTLPSEVFDKVDRLGAPRLVEYWEQDPCAPGSDDDLRVRKGGGLGGIGGGTKGSGAGGGVTVEAQFTVGEYEIVILSAKDSSGLEGWLQEQKYAIPAGSEPYFRPYVQSGSKFFVARVDPSKVTFKDGRATLSPLRFHYDSPDFTLPVRLGLVNSSGMQDLIVNILARQRRYEVANYPNITIPTNLDVAESARGRFGEFYAALFDQTVAKNPKAVVTEYSWDAGTCDPCPGPTLDGNDVMTLGADVTQAASFLSSSTTRSQFTTDVQITQAAKATSGKVPTDADRVIAGLRPRYRACYNAALEASPGLSGTLALKFVVGKEGEVTSAIAEGTIKDEKLKACVAGVLKRAQFSPPDGGQATLGTTISFNVSDASAPARVVTSSSAADFVLTRLHVRYGKDSLGEDLVFTSAKPIAGGREVKDPKGALETGSGSSSRNNFQARYAIRHPWTGAMACKEPRRNVWGGPPPNTAAPATLPARNTAFAPRGQAQVTSFLAPGANLEIGQATLPEPPSTPVADGDGGVDAGTGPSSSRRGCAGCAMTESSDLETMLGGSFVGLGLAGAAVRRRARRR